MDLESLNKFVINLPSRTDRLEQVKKELAGWNYVVVPGIKKESVMAGIGQAHLCCIANAKFLGLPYVLIMEDDLVLRKGIETYLNEALNNLPEDWDLLLGGAYQIKSFKSYNDHWDELGEFCGLHFYIVNEKAYDKILTYDGQQHIDRWMKKCANLNCYVTKKFVATQRPGVSDNVKSYQDYSHLIKKHKLL